MAISIRPLPMPRARDENGELQIMERHVTGVSDKQVDELGCSAPRNLDRSLTDQTMSEVSRAGWLSDAI
jgi:hypothetical protein